MKVQLDQMHARAHSEGREGSKLAMMKVEVDQMNALK